MSFDVDEISVEDAQPIELYMFTYLGTNYQYTTSYYTQNIDVNGEIFSFVPEYIKRGDSLRQSSSSEDETCVVTVSRSNPVALLFQGSPPEVDTVKLQIFRIHGEDSSEYIRILRGIVSQVRFTNSDAELTITIEHILSTEIPRGKLSYFCQNCIYDTKCRIDREQYKHKCYKEGEDWGLTIISNNLLENDVPSDYYTDGYMQMGNSFRQIAKHDGNKITIKYPINLVDRQTEFYVYPGCNNLFEQCHKKFGNTENFSGIPYQQPYDVFRHPVNKGVYWVDGNIVYRDTNRKLYSMNL